MLPQCSCNIFNIVYWNQRYISLSPASTISVKSWSKTASIRNSRHTQLLAGYAYIYLHYIATEYIYTYTYIISSITHAHREKETTRLSALLLAYSLPQSPHIYIYPHIHSLSPAHRSEQFSSRRAAAESNLSDSSLASLAQSTSGGAWNAVASCRASRLASVLSLSRHPRQSSSSSPSAS